MTTRRNWVFGVAVAALTITVLVHTYRSEVGPSVATMRAEPIAQAPGGCTLTSDVGGRVAGGMPMELNLHKEISRTFTCTTLPESTIAHYNALIGTSEYAYDKDWGAFARPIRDEMGQFRRWFAALESRSPEMTIRVEVKRGPDPTLHTIEFRAEGKRY